MGRCFVSALLLVTGTAALLAPRDPVAQRLAAAGIGPEVTDGAELGLRVATEQEGGGGLWGFLLPRNVRERSHVRRVLWTAGFEGPHVVRNYFLLRVVLAVLLPLPVILAVLFTSIRIGSDAVQFDLPGLHLSGALLLVLLLVTVGFYGPAIVLRFRVEARREALRRAFPNALDLLQLSVEAGLGVDAALSRVAEEMMLAHPALAREFALIIVELRAGKPREAVLKDFADRTGVEEVRSFVTVLQQTVEFGTNMVDALRVYASEMRQQRMLGAEEKANKLSVKLSAAIVLIMMPAVLGMIMGPIIIRAVRIILPALGVS